MTLQQALNALPSDADLSSTFGWRGEGGCVEYYRTASGEVWRVSNGQYDAPKPFIWRCERA